jgi:hypothetical protein
MKLAPVLTLILSPSRVTKIFSALDRYYHQEVRSELARRKKVSDGLILACHSFHRAAPSQKGVNACRSYAFCYAIDVNGTELGQEWRDAAHLHGSSSWRPPHIVTVVASLASLMLLNAR